jgi:threonyl-tRNA synthetase
MSEIVIKLPNGSEKRLPTGATALDLATTISPKLAEAVVVARVNGEVCDLQDPLPDGASVELLKPESAEGLDALRHSCEHVLAAAVIKLFAGAQVTMGPKTHAGEFYYDFDIGRAFTPDDIVLIEKEMTRLIDGKMAFKKSWMSKPEALALFTNLGQRYKPEILEWIKDDKVSIYQNGDFVDLCRGPHLPHTGFIKAFKLLNVSGSYWRADASREMLQRVSGIAFASKKDLEAHVHRVDEAKKRDHRKLGEQLGLFFVSQRFDGHEYVKGDDVEVLVTGSVRKDLFGKPGFTAETLFSEEIRQGVEQALSDVKLRMSGFSVGSHELERETQSEIDLRIFSSSVTKEQKLALSELEKRLNKDESAKFRIVIESRFAEEIGPGLVTWLPKGGRLRVIIEDVWRKMHLEGGYDIVFSPHLAKSDLWKVSGHWNFYRESMFAPMVVDGQEYMLKPMNCPFHVLAYKNTPRSYRELPLRFAELGTVYRYELAGVMHGLMRVRGFTQDDAHIFCRWDQLDQEIDSLLDFVIKMLQVFGFTKFEVNLATRPEKYVGELDQWERAEAALLAGVKRHNLPFVVDAGGGAFYGPKIDIKLRDCLDREWQCSTVQLDFNNPERFHLSYTNDEGKPESPVMLHRALLGSIERFVGILIEEYAGAFPMWLSPEQVRILAIADRHLDYAQELAKALTKAGIRVTVPTTSEKLGAKIRDAQMEKVPLMLVIGDEEVTKKGATLRDRSAGDLGFKSEAELVTYCVEKSRIPT